ncbi:MAG TPA: hypothetical protein ENG91_03615, partial [Desulfobacteraceae bacterium]|nr:hypothetical protein [Desulfobacteraceae bacterium]
AAALDPLHYGLRIADGELDPDLRKTPAEKGKEAREEIDVEGKRMGVDERLIRLLADHATIQTTYAGGVATMADLELVREAGQERLDVTVGSALDFFGGTLAYRDVVAFCREQDGQRGR